MIIILFGLISNVVMKSGHYKNWNSIAKGYAMFSLWMMGFVLRIFITRDQYFKDFVQSYGQYYVNVLKSLTS